MNEYHVSTDKVQLDIDLIVDYLKNQSYWARERTETAIRSSIENSFCFGIYSQAGEQVGFARVVTDYAVFAWVMDVFVLVEHQRKGLGQQLMQEIISHPKLTTVLRWGLGTRDAHKLYEKFGFNVLSKPGMIMERIVKLDNQD
jgi:GNAT superfamily N-acetyltransferase